MEASGTMWWLHTWQQFDTQSRSNDKWIMSIFGIWRLLRLCEYLAFWRSSRSRQSRAHPGQNYDRGKGRGSLGCACWFPGTFMCRTPLNSHNCDLRILISIFRSAKRGEANIRMTILLHPQSHVLPLLWPQCFRKMARLKEKTKTNISLIYKIKFLGCSFRNLSLIFLVGGQESGILAKFIPGLFSTRRLLEGYPVMPWGEGSPGHPFPWDLYLFCAPPPHFWSIPLGFSSCQNPLPRK